MYIDKIFALYGYFILLFLFTHLYCLVGCLGVIVLTHAVLGVLYACVLYFCICTCSAQLGMFHVERRSRNMLIIIIIIIMLAVFVCRAGITFVSVHDCFWTHACDVEIMNKVKFRGHEPGAVWRL